MMTRLRVLLLPTSKHAVQRTISLIGRKKRIMDEIGILFVPIFYLSVLVAESAGILSVDLI